MLRSNWLRRLQSRWNRRQRMGLRRNEFRRQLFAESLENRLLLVADFGDPPLPYPTLIAENGAQHTTGGALMLGATVDSEADGTHSAAADADGADEDGVTFGTITVGALGATVTVNVTGAAGKLDAWIDFNGDGAWGGPGEQIFASQNVVVGNNNLTFDVPSWAKDGVTFARFRLSTAGGLGTEGLAANGEVEDYAVTVIPPAAASGVFGGQNVVTTGAGEASSVFAADVDGDGDMDMLSASFHDDKIAWYENDGSQNFTAHTISTAANGAWSVFAADVDGDGDTDVLSASVLDDKIAWYENDGSQNFTAHTISTAAIGAFSVFAADVDGDGDTDALSASGGDDKIAWYENDGSQNFTSHTISTAADRAESVFAADVDGDGDIDVLSASRYDNKIAWYENDGSQNFTAHTISTTAAGTNSVFAADVDGDGDTDVLSASNGDNKIAWYENNGSQNFTEHTISTAANGAWSVFAADLDGDGDTDVLSASASDDKIAWYENDGSQNFTAHTISTAADVAYSVFVADVDGDGDTDVLSASEGDSKIAWYENLDSDYGDAPTPYPTTDAENGARHKAIGLTLGATRDAEANGTHSANADADGADENGVTFGTIMVGALGATVTVNVTGAAGKLDAWIDFNGDGAWGGPGEQIFASQNVVVGANNLTFDVPSWAKDGVTFARFRLSTAGGLGTEGLAADGEVEDYAVTVIPPATASGVFGGQNIVTTGADGASSVFAADVDGDGDMDMLSASLFDGKIAWYENDGSQNFTAHTISTAADGAYSVFAADVDGDGDVDVLSASANDDKIAWYENDGSQNFTAHTISAGANVARSVFAADVDGDGDTDVLSASRDDHKIAWYENDGSQNFTAHTISTAANGASSVFAADVDGDGDTDVLSASRNDDQIAWYENDGSQNFTAHTISTAADVAQSVFAADVDRDGDTDVLSASLNDDKIAWYENDGSQNFTAHTISTAANGASSVFAADVDGDGDTDVLSALTSDAKIAWYENDGSQNFTAHTISTAANGANSVFAADVDGDGDTDVLSASLFVDKIAWYENTNPVTTDFGDAPAPYPTTLAENGARHTATGPTLGATRDGEADGTHSANADADGADEDGVTSAGPLVVGQTTNITINVSAPGFVNAWADLNRDGDWDDLGEQFLTNFAVVAGNNTIPFSIPSNFTPGDVVNRYRLTSASVGSPSPTGLLPDGEVEDYVGTILEAPSLIVTTATDVVNNTDGLTSLREAVAFANAQTGADAITFGNGSAISGGTDFTDGTADTILLTLGQMSIGASVSITGLSASHTIIDAQTLSRIFDIAGANVDVTLDGLTLRNGRTTGGVGVGDGGAIRSTADAASELVIQNSTFTGNSAPSAQGGAVYSPQGDIVIQSSTFSGNSTGSLGNPNIGGTIYANTGDVDVISSTLSGNSGSFGGAIAALSGRLAVINSTLSGNSVSHDGGAIIAGFGPDVVIVNSTITLNTAAARGGGIYLLGPANPSDLTLLNSIVAGNTAPNESDIDRSNPIANSVLTAFHSLIGNNSSTGLAATDHANRIADANGNFVGGGAFSVIDIATVLNTTPANNGGPTLTHALTPGGLAHNTGDNALAETLGDDGLPGTNDPNEVALTADQRGAPFARSFGTAVDMGAFESTVQLDFGDAPSGYPVTLAANGARHIATGPTLGATRDTEEDGQPNAGATGDGADEDGITAAGPLVVGQTTNITINVSAPGFVNAWSDLNRDGDFDDVLFGEQFLTNFAVVAGNNVIPFAIPANFTPGQVVSRYRLTSASVASPSPTGLLPDGEVEDYVGTILEAPSLIVTTASDASNNTDNVTSLREALTYANAIPGLDTIGFNIPGAGPHTIQPTSALPTVTGAVIVDGTTEPNFVSTPVIELDGSLAGAGTNGLLITAGSSTVRGLVINRFAGAGIRLQTGGGNTIAGNYIGTDITGALDRGNAGEGVLLVSSPSNTIGGTVAADLNVISGNNRFGVEIDNAAATGNVVRGNFIGTNFDGTVAVGNTFDGVLIYNAPSNTIGGTAVGAGNVISGNLRHGLNLTAGAASNLVEGNRIGTNPLGTATVGNALNGVQIQNSPTNTIGGTAAGARNVISGNSRNGVLLTAAGATGNLVQGNFIGTDVTGTLDQGNTLSGIKVELSAATNTLGGAAAGARNIISGNNEGGVYLLTGTTGNLLQGNYIGTDVSGTLDLGNSKEGVLLVRTSSNTIGGTAAGAGNVISGNDRSGVEIDNAPATGNLVQGNFIGTKFDGTGAVGNTLDGVLIYAAASNTIGGTVVGAGNVISGNLRHGVNLKENATNTRILRNSIFTNTSLGIDLNGDGVTANDVNDPDTGPNKRQNFPVMTSVVLSGANLNFTYSVPSIAPNSTFPLRVEFFIADAANQEGKMFLGADSHTTPGTKMVTIPAGSAVLGTKIVATATDNNGAGSTSEFSANATVASSLLAAGGEASATANSAALTSAQLAPLVDAAMSRLAATGLTSAQVRQLSSVSFAIADLPGATLGLATSNAITLDATAAGYGWFVDPTPRDDAEFRNPKSQTPNRQSMDLLTAVMHELSHTLGRSDLHDHGTEDDLMYESLAVGVRRTSFAVAADVLFDNNRW